MNLPTRLALMKDVAGACSVASRLAWGEDALVQHIATFGNESGVDEMFLTGDVPTLRKWCATMLRKAVGVMRSATEAITLTASQRMQTMEQSALCTSPAALLIDGAEEEGEAAFTRRFCSDADGEAFDEAYRKGNIGAMRETTAKLYEKVADALEAEPQLRRVPRNKALELRLWGNKAAVIASILTCDTPKGMYAKSDALRWGDTAAFASGDVAKMRESTAAFLRTCADELDKGGKCAELTKARRSLLGEWFAAVLGLRVFLCDPFAEVGTLTAAVDAYEDPFGVDEAVSTGDASAIRTAGAKFFRECAEKIGGAK